MGEMLGSRIRTGIYLPTGFGLIPRALVWGFLGYDGQGSIYDLCQRSTIDNREHLGMDRYLPL
ncbi:MAG: hypothetical protein MZV63_05680 [Marinilabiliales bacterium]|nr:hypothetical protein [Marinilabiliales bacterium]